MTLTHADISALAAEMAPMVARMLADIMAGKTQAEKQAVPAAGSYEARKREALEREARNQQRRQRHA